MIDAALHNACNALGLPLAERAGYAPEAATEGALIALLCECKRRAEAHYAGARRFALGADAPRTVLALFRRADFVALPIQSRGYVAAVCWWRLVAAAEKRVAADQIALQKQHPSLADVQAAQQATAKHAAELSALDEIRATYKATHTCTIAARERAREWARTISGDVGVFIRESMRDPLDGGAAQRPLAECWLWQKRGLLKHSTAADALFDAVAAFAQNLADARLDALRQAHGTARRIVAAMNAVISDATKGGAEK